jgi:hypothetical protein
MLSSFNYNNDDIKPFSGVQAFWTRHQWPSRRQFWSSCSRSPHWSQYLCFIRRYSDDTANKFCSYCRFGSWRSFPTTSSLVWGLQGHPQPHETLNGHSMSCYYYFFSPYGIPTTTSPGRRSCRDPHVEHEYLTSKTIPIFSTHFLKFYASKTSRYHVFWAYYIPLNSTHIIHLCFWSFWLPAGPSSSSSYSNACSN